MLNAAARVVSDTKKFDQGLSRLMHQELHWLDIPERVNYKLGVLTHRCLLGKAPVYLSNCCIPVSQVASCGIYGLRAFAVAGPTMFNTLPDVRYLLTYLLTVGRGKVIHNQISTKSLLFLPTGRPSTIYSIIR